MNHVAGRIRTGGVRALVLLKVHAEAVQTHLPIVLAVVSGNADPLQNVFLDPILSKHARLIRRVVLVLPRGGGPKRLPEVPHIVTVSSALSKSDSTEAEVGEKEPVAWGFP
jgi:hypothetical protein